MKIANNFFFTTFAHPDSKTIARMAKLVDALVSGTSDRKVVQVRVLFRAPSTKPKYWNTVFWFFSF